MVLMSTCLFHSIVPILIGSKWSDCPGVIQNGADLCLSVPLCYSLINRE